MECPDEFMCTSCNQRGHLTAFCRATACHNCGEGSHKYSQCSRPTFCLNCGSRQHTRNLCQQPPSRSSTVSCTLSAQEATEEYITSIFGQFGKILHVRQTRRPSITHGFAYFVGRKMEKHAGKACQKLPLKPLNGNILTVQPATSTSVMRDNAVTLFIGNIPIMTPEEQLRDLFKKFKSFNEVRIHRAPIMAEVVFDDTAAAKKACLMLQGTEWGGPPLSVELKKDAPPPPAKKKDKKAKKEKVKKEKKKGKRKRRSRLSSSSSTDATGSSHSSSSSSATASRRSRSRHSRKRSRSSSDSDSPSTRRSRKGSRSKTRSRSPPGKEGSKGAKTDPKAADSRPLPDGWCRAVDPKTKAPYYIHIATRTSSWTFPTSSDPPLRPDQENKPKAPETPARESKAPTKFADPEPPEAKPAKKAADDVAPTTVEDKPAAGEAAPTAPEPTATAPTAAEPSTAGGKVVVEAPVASEAKAKDSGDSDSSTPSSPQ